jgi:lipopolysaccharide/colanic/teichoic acid biosynthesis glycosyltransferase
LPREKRACDLALSIAVAVLAAPVALAAGVAMGVDMLLRPADRGRWLYRERRISRGREFELLKLRTLREDVLERMPPEESHVRLLELDPNNLTWAGRHVLKPWYLDELPQLVNVLRGEMSIVGPRPWPPSLVRRQVERGIDYRLRATAGWTGPVQVSKGNADPTAYEMLDIAYLERCRRSRGWTLVRYDLGIARATLAIILRREGLRF